MQLAKFLASNGRPQVGKIMGEAIQTLDLHKAGFDSLSGLLSTPVCKSVAEKLQTVGDPIPFSKVKWLPPIDRQEVWAAGVTYKRSQTARMEESEAAASCYDRVYKALRPEIFFKATPHRVSGHQGDLRIRVDAKWNVPEPELAIVLSRSLDIIGFTIGNDMSSRDIEGDNPLYLPQAKCYNQCCGLGPWITLVDAMPPRDQIDIGLKIFRANEVVFDQSTSVSQMARTLEDLVSWLGRDNSFPDGAFLLTGTGIVPDSSFTLAPNDVVDVTISGIGTLSNSIVQG